MKSKLFLLALSFLLLNIANPSFAQNEDKIVIFQTSQGEIVLEFFPDKAPKTVENFLKLAESGFYDGTVFHRIIKDFMIQGGDPLSKSEDNINQWGTGDPGYKIDAEFNDIGHVRGVISMARALDPNSAGSQFFIVHKDSNFLDGQYTAFGRIITQESYETLEKIASLETNARDQPVDWNQAKILSTQVVTRSEISNTIELDAPQQASTATELLTNQYANEKYGFEINFPSGWFVQEPQQTHSEVPDVVAFKTGANGVSSQITVKTRYFDGKSLDEVVSEIKESLQTSIAQGQSEILSEEKKIINGKDAYEITTKGTFDSPDGPIDIQFRAILLSDSDKYFELVYANTADSFDAELSKFNEAINSFSIHSVETSNEQLQQEKETQQIDLESIEESNDEGGCLIATAAFGSELSTPVQLLRETRDSKLMQTESGKSFLQEFNKFYYAFSPTIADWEREIPIFKEAVKITITPLLASLSILNHVDIDSEAEMIGYGISIILLNAGMYFVIPTLAIYKIKNRFF